jgi:hypothetical protein
MMTTGNREQGTAKTLAELVLGATMNVLIGNAKGAPSGAPFFSESKLQP